jgi:hypothetical protein
LRKCKSWYLAPAGPGASDLQQSAPAQAGGGRKKTPRRGVFHFRRLKSSGLDIGSLLAFRALRDFELNFLTFFEGLETVHVDCGEVSEQIFAAVIWGDEAKTFGIIEPLYSTCCHKQNFQIKTDHTSHKSKKLLAPSSRLTSYQHVHFCTEPITHC